MSRTVPAVEIVPAPTGGYYVAYAGEGVYMRSTLHEAVRLMLRFSPTAIAPGDWPDNRPKYRWLPAKLHFAKKHLASLLPLETVR